jgi:hypothetical protein
MARKNAVISGVKELNAALDSITDPKFRKRALVSAGKKIMQPVLMMAISNAPTLKVSPKNPDGITGGELKSDIKMRTSFKASPVTKSGKMAKGSELTISVSTGKLTSDYALSVEYGREELSIVRTNAFGRDTQPFMGTVPKIDPNPFMLPALKSIEGTVEADFGRELFKSIGIELGKQKKGAK